MPPWLALSVAEARRARGLIALGRRQPVLAALAVASAAAMFWASWRGGVAAGRALRDAPAALLTVNALVLWLCILVGAGSSLVAPRLDRWDEQLRLLPLRRASVFAGTTAAPLLAGWLIATAPLLAFAVPVFRAIPGAHPAFWSAMFEATCLAACAAGAGLAETLRWLWFQRTWRGVTPRVLAGLGAMAIFIAPAVAGRQPWWSGLAVLLPHAGQSETTTAPSVVVDTPLVAALAASAFGAWILVGSVPTRMRHSGVGRWRLPHSWNGRYALLAWWGLASLVREPRMWLTAAFTVASAAFFVFADRIIGNGTHAFAQFAPLAAVMGGAQVALFLSERLQASAWFWRLTPALRRTPGLWWWAGASSLAAAISLPALVIPGIDGQLRSPMGAVVLASSCLWAAAIGRLSPWDSRSQGQQTAVTMLYFTALFAAAAGFDWLTQRTSPAIGLATVMTACAVLTAGICVHLPWRASWRAT